jgi:hypothetical protein
MKPRRWVGLGPLDIWELATRAGVARSEFEKEKKHPSSASASKPAFLYPTLFSKQRFDQSLIFAGPPPTFVTDISNPPFDRIMFPIIRPIPATAAVVAALAGRPAAVS